MLTIAATMNAIRLFISPMLGWAVVGWVLYGCAPTVEFTATPTTGEAPLRVSFDNHTRKADRIEWDFGDGHTSHLAEPAHTYRLSGTYTVTLRAWKGKRLRQKEFIVEVQAPTRCLVEIETPYGAILVELSDATPLHRDNFLGLAEEGFYDSLLFHRVVRGFVIQGGDPQSKNAQPTTRLGMGGPGYTLPAEFVDTLIHLRGALAAARLPDQVNPEKRSSGSQFYIVQGRPVSDELLDRVEAMKGFRYPSALRKKYLERGGTPQLDGDYTVFGRVIQGFDVLDRIADLPVDAHSRPMEDVWMVLHVIK